MTARLLKRRSADRGDDPGLILLQIDGLSRSQFERGVAEGRLPFLEHLADWGDVDLVSFYSGCPSTTAAVQGEVMFGERCAVPAYEYYDRVQGRMMRMFDASAAKAVGDRLAAERESILRDGVSYSNIYAGDAAEGRFCAETLEEDKRRLLGRPMQTLGLAVLYFFTILRVSFWAFVECVIALGDSTWGIARGEDPATESKFIMPRVAVSIVLREYLRVAVKLAIEEGRPVIYANFLGYDEHAHKRGPGSWFAHWVLKGIDVAIADIVRTSRRSHGRDYEVVVFSDHGQEQTRQYDRLHGRSIQDAVKDLLAEGPEAARGVWPKEPTPSRGREFNRRARQLLRKKGRTAASAIGDEDDGEHNSDDVAIAAVGPLGHIYWPTPLDIESLDRFAEQLVNRAHVPLVVWRDSGGAVCARNRAGRWKLPEDAAAVLGADHPFLVEAAADLAALCHHPEAGDLVISGWSLDEPPVTFVAENGAHGSVGSEEMRGFALVPDGVRAKRARNAAGEQYLRGEDLYGAGRRLLVGREADTREPNGQISKSLVGWPLPTEAASSAVQPRYRVMTYNIHSCIGLDGRVRPERIADVIRRAGADVIALQEVDCNRRRSRTTDQAGFLADQLQMAHHYYAVFESADEQYGLAIISRWPLVHIQSSHLTPANSRRRSEARGAMWVQIDAPGGPLHVMNTHFGLRANERVEQARLLMGERWLGQVPSDQPLALCGDFNAGPASAPYKTIAGALREVQASAPGHRPRATFPSPLPLRRLDHIFVNSALAVRGIVLPRTSNAVISSDHLPVCADLELSQSRPE